MNCKKLYCSCFNSQPRKEADNLTGGFFFWFEWCFNSQPRKEADEVRTTDRMEAFRFNSQPRKEADIFCREISFPTIMCQLTASQGG